MNSLSVEENERAIFPNRYIRMNCLPNLLEQRLLEEKKKSFAAAEFDKPYV